MKKQARAFIVGVLILVLCQPLALALPVRLTSSTVTGDGISVLTVQGDPDENGIIFRVKEPERSFQAWTAIAFNSTDQPVTNLVITLKVLIDGQWYLPDTEASQRLMHPMVILPGEFAFADLGSIGGTPMAWDDTMITVDSINTPNEYNAVDLQVDSITESSGRFTGTITNHRDTSVTHVTLYVGCISSDELAANHTWVSDVLQLKPGRTESFEFGSKYMPDECGSNPLVIATAVGRSKE